MSGGTSRRWEHDAHLTWVGIDDRVVLQLQSPKIQLVTSDTKLKQAKASPPKIQQLCYSSSGQEGIGFLLWSNADGFVL